MSGLPFEQVRSLALAHASRLLGDWFPEGKITGREFRVGSLHGEPGESLSVNLNTGHWADFANPTDKGGDLIDLLAALRHGGDTGGAVRELAGSLGLNVNGKEASAAGHQTNGARPSAVSEWQPMVPPPKGVAPPPDAQLSDFDVVYEYKDLQDRVTHYVGRVEARVGRKKVFIPVTYGSLDGKPGWHRRGTANPKPLYGLNRLSAFPEAPVLLCEGEKAADAAQALFPDYACLSWCGGTGSVQHADLEPLKSRAVNLWPDNDLAGHKAIQELARRLPDARIVRVDDLAEGFDAADLHTDDPAAWLRNRLLAPALALATGQKLPGALATVELRSKYPDVAARYEARKRADAKAEAAAAKQQAADHAKPPPPGRPKVRGTTRSGRPQHEQKTNDAALGREDPGYARAQDETATGLVLDPGAPLESARALIVRKYTTGNGRTLHHQKDAFYYWSGTHYGETTPEEMRAAIYGFLDTATREKKGFLVPFDPTRSKVADVLEASAAEVQLPYNIRAPAWLDTAEHPPAHEIIVCTNGLLHLPSRKILRHTPGFFSFNALDFAYDADASPPDQWLDFLNTLWPDDPQSVDGLGEMFGLLLTGETRHQKAFLMVGPKRSGKGTIARVLTRLLGQANVCGPTLSSLGQNFGLAPLIGKRLAVISDARLGGKTDQHIIVERILAITGEDSLTVDRKYRDGWTGRLNVRFLMLSNELPRLSDASGALASRFILWVLKKSFFGKEDLSLTNRLMHELPGILNWALAGWDRLNERGHFLQPSTGAEAQREMEDLGSPIGAFLRDQCVVGQGKTVAVDDLYNAWCKWCWEQGRDHPGTKQAFGRDLRAALPGLGVVQHGTPGGQRTRHYDGVTHDPKGAGDALDPSH